jgi:hypothetical protein
VAGTAHNRLHDRLAGQRAIVSVIIKDWLDWGELSRYGEERARATAAKRGRNWNAMTADEREAFIDELVHEDRK